MRKKRTLYNYEIPREKLKTGLYDSAIEMNKKEKI